MAVLARRTAPRLVAASAHATGPARLRAAASRRRGGRGTVELFFAFDDPCSAVAVEELSRRLAARPVDLQLIPVVSRGMADDPAVEQKRAYALLDARRLARGRLGLEIARTSTLEPERTAFLAAWVAAEPAGPGLDAFCREALARLWFEREEALSEAELSALWRDRVGGAPRADASALRRNEARMRRRGPYETPAAWVAGRWYFAQDRPTQICAWLDELGWAER